MMVPQPTAQYGQVERVSLARAILSVRNCAYAGFKSKPNTAAAAPPIVVNFRKSRRVGCILRSPPQVERKTRPRGNSFIRLASFGVKRDFANFADPSRGPDSLYLTTRELHPTQNTLGSQKEASRSAPLHDTMDAIENMGLARSVIFGSARPYEL